MKKINVFLHTQSWTIPGSKNTDIKLRKVFLRLSAAYPQINMVHPESFFSGIEFIFKLFLIRVSQKLFNRNLSPFDNEQHYIYYKEFKKHKIDVIIAQGQMPKNTYGVPVIWEVHFIPPEVGEIIVNERIKANWLKKVVKYRELSKKAEIIGVRDSYSIKVFQELIPEAKGKLRLLPFYLPDLKAIRENEVIEKQQNHSIIKILFVGGGAKRKGLEVLIEAFKLLHEKFSDIELTIVSSLSGGNVNIPSNLPIIHHHFAEHNKVLDLFKSAHIYAMPSLHETFGITYLEGMANGCVILARDKMPQIDILDHGQSGLLANPLNASEIADKLYEVCINNQLRLTLALKGREKFLSTYSSDIVGKSWVNTFNNIIRK